MTSEERNDPVARPEFPGRKEHGPFVLYMYPNMPPNVPLTARFCANALIEDTNSTGTDRDPKKARMSGNAVLNCLWIPHNQRWSGARRSNNVHYVRGDHRTSQVQGSQFQIFSTVLPDQERNTLLRESSAGNLYSEAEITVSSVWVPQNMIRGKWIRSPFSQDQIFHWRQFSAACED